MDKPSKLKPDDVVRRNKDYIVNMTISTEEIFNNINFGDRVLTPIQKANIYDNINVIVTANKMNKVFTDATVTHLKRVCISELSERIVHAVFHPEEPTKTEEPKDEPKDESNDA